MEYQQICPVSLASEVIAERWTPLILREIVLFNRRHFGEIQHGVGRISQSLLAKRLRGLEQAAVIERRPNRRGRGWEYHPTPAGQELDRVLNELGIWAQHWIDLRREHCDPSYLMMTVHSLLKPDRLPKTPTTVRFEFTSEPKIYWLVFDGQEPELCYYDPGRESDLVVIVDEQVFGGVLLGRLSFGEAIERGAIRFDGSPQLARDFPNWLWPSRFARHGADQRWPKLAAAATATAMPAAV